MIVRRVSFELNQGGMNRTALVYCLLVYIRSLLIISHQIFVWIVLVLTLVSPSPSLLFCSVVFFTSALAPDLVDYIYSFEYATPFAKSDKLLFCRLVCTLLLRMSDSIRTHVVC